MFIDCDKAWLSQALSHLTLTIVHSFWVNSLKPDPLQVLVCENLPVYLV